MEIKHVLLGVVEAAAWYFFFCFGLDSIKRGRNPWLAAAVLLGLFNLAFVACPWLRHSDLWSRL